MPSRSIRLCADLRFPADLATTTTLVVGKRGSGKTNTCGVLAEQFAGAGVPFAVLDPADAWWGLKYSRDGKGRGLDVYVFGGRRGDLPLEPGSGSLMADVLVDHRVSAVFSVKHFTGGERSRFVTDFAKRLFQRNSEPIHVFLEEAHEVAPQNPSKADREAEMVGAINRLWKLGRGAGIGGSAITQRPASLSKNVTTQAEVLVVHRIIGPQDVAAIREWIRYHGQREDILSELSTLKTGEAYVWAPDFPEHEPVGLVRAKIDARATFDSSATPRAGESRKDPASVEPLDLEALGEKVAATIERARENDPRELHARIAELEDRLARAAPAMDYDSIAAERAEGRRVLVAGVSSRLGHTRSTIAHGIEAAAEASRLAAEATERAGSLLAAAETTRKRLQIAEDDLEKLEEFLDAKDEPAKGMSSVYGEPLRDNPGTARLPDRDHPGHSRRPRVLAPLKLVSGPADMPPRRLRILEAIGRLEETEFEVVPRELAALLAGTVPDSSTFEKDLGALRTAGLVEYRSTGTVNLTDAAFKLSTRKSLSERDLHAAIVAKLPPRRRRIVDVLLALRGRPLDRAMVATRACTSADSSTFEKDVGYLRSTLGVLVYPSSGQVAAAAHLFIPGGR
jgi:hypothetical protein